ncbi:ECF transporter S component [Azotosporobacter soli]|uniref:ECF transporter S component n=1 Tax=Azotosporobacter soli TaxID=3055040 RepID=UPI0031FF157D
MTDKRSFTVRDMTYVGILAALCIAGTMIKIPLGTGAMVHLGTAVVFTSGILFGGVYAGLAAAIGSAFFDLLMGFSPYTVWSFVIKGGAGLIVGTVAKGLWPESSGSNEKWLLRAVFGCLLAAAWTLGGYVAAWTQVIGSFTVALGNMPASLLTSTAGFIVAMALAPKLRKAIKR